MTDLRLVDVITLLGIAFGVAGFRENAFRERVKYAGRSGAVLNARGEAPSRNTHDWHSLHRLLTLLMLGFVKVDADRATAAVHHHWLTTWLPFWARTWTERSTERLVVLVASEEQIELGDPVHPATMRVLLGTGPAARTFLAGWEDTRPGRIPGEQVPPNDPGPPPVGWRILSASGPVQRMAELLEVSYPDRLEAFLHIAGQHWDHDAGRPRWPDPLPEPAPRSGFRLPALGASSPAIRPDVTVEWLEQPWSFRTTGHGALT